MSENQTFQDAMAQTTTSKLLQAIAGVFLIRGVLRGGTTAQWEQNDSPLLYKELGVEFTTDGRILFKIGPETENPLYGTPWSEIPYASGPVGPSPEFEWSGTSIRFKKNDATWGDWVNLVGPSVEYQWDDTSLRLKNPDGTWGEAVDLRGPQGPQGPSGYLQPDNTTVTLTEDGTLSVINSPLWAGRAIFSSTAEPTAEEGNVGDIWLKLAE